MTRLNQCYPSTRGVDSYGGIVHLSLVLNRKRVAKKLASRLRQLRESNGLSQEDLAYQAGLGRSYYWRVEQGLINVTLETLVKLCNALKIEMGDLFPK